jgi:myo-inositol 2-dehydrogenase/D-chiro-inositol 1-dehydrogenase
MFRVGLVGAGLMGTLHAASWAQTPARLVAVHAKNRDQAGKLAQQHDAQAAGSLETLLDAVDVVDICTPTHRHHEMVLAAAAAGRHIVCEKPLARTPKQAEEMVAACERAGVRLLVAHVVRFFPEYAQAKSIVDRGEIGHVGVVRLKRVSSRPGWATDNWLFDAEKSGGMMLDLMIHDFDYARWVAGEVESVFARSIGNIRPDALTDYALVIMRHTNSALSHVEGGWAYPAGMFRTSLEIAGDQGLIEHPVGSSVPLGIYLKQSGDGKKGGEVPASPLLENPYATEIKHFYEVIVHDAAPRVTAKDGLAALKIAFAAIESAKTGQRVTV